VDRALLLRYRKAGIFNGLDKTGLLADVDVTTGEAVGHATPMDSIRDPEALGRVS
jgi:hypothetical protein